MTSLSANIAVPGCELQDLHRRGLHRPAVPGLPVVTDVVWMLDDVDDVNGGTRVVPGSHRWDHALEEHAPADVRPNAST